MESAKQSKTDKPWLWKPGQSGNPAGRPEKVSLTAILMRKLKEADPDEPEKIRAEKVVEVALAKAEAGDFQMFKEIYDRVEGKVTQPVDVTTETVSRDAKVERIKAKVKESQTAALKN